MSNGPRPVPLPTHETVGWMLPAAVVAGIVVAALLGPQAIARVITWSGGKPLDVPQLGERMALAFAWLAIVLCVASLFGLHKAGGPHPIQLTPPAWLGWMHRHRTLAALGRWLLGFVAMGVGYFVGTVVFT